MVIELKKHWSNAWCTVNWEHVALTHPHLSFALFVKSGCVQCLWNKNINSQTGRSPTKQGVWNKVYVWQPNTKLNPQQMSFVQKHRLRGGAGVRFLVERICGRGAEVLLELEAVTRAWYNFHTLRLGQCTNLIGSRWPFLPWNLAYSNKFCWYFYLELTDTECERSQARILIQQSNGVTKCSSHWADAGYFTQMTTHSLWEPCQSARSVANFWKNSFVWEDSSASTK